MSNSCVSPTYLFMFMFNLLFQTPCYICVCMCICDLLHFILYLLCYKVNFLYVVMNGVTGSDT